MSKTILITGAGKGIGFATTKYLSQLNHNIIAISRNIERLRGIEHVIPYAMDLTDIDAYENLLSFLDEHKLKIDGLINNAGLLINKPFEDLNDKDWLRSYDVNVIAPVRLIRSLLQKFNSDSHIVNISSMGGYQGSSKYPGLAAYSTAKGALTILTECLAAELEPKSIASNCLCLGAVQTEMLAEAFPGYVAPTTPDQMGKYIGDFLLNASQVMNGKVLAVSMSNP